MLKLYLKRVKITETNPSDHKQTNPSKTHNYTNSHQNTQTYTQLQNRKARTQNLN